MSNGALINGSGTVDWSYPKIGTCGEPCDTLRISICRTRAIDDLILSFDGVRNGWVISGSFRKGEDYEIREVGFISEWDSEEEQGI